MRVLIVESEKLTRRLFEQRLQAVGHEITSCADAESAWQAYQIETYPLLIVDWILPGMDGLELCRRIRALPQGAHSTILVATSRIGEDHLQTVLEAGADDYLPKPVDWGLFQIRLKIAEQRVHELHERKRAEGQVTTELEKSHNDLCSILDQLRVGAALTDGEGCITFMNETAQSLFTGTEQAGLLGRPWNEVFPFEKADQEQIQEMFGCDPEQRQRISSQVSGAGGRTHWVDIDIQDAPRDPQCKIFFYYDVSEIYGLRQLLDKKSKFHNLVGQSKVMRQVYEQIRELSRVDLTTLIEGETGSGKELAARAIHFSSHRNDQPFVVANCANLTESLIGSQLFGHRRGAFTGAIEDHQGLLEAASGGTLLLDEIGDVPLAIQASLLRALQEKEVTRLGETQPRKIDVRILAATHRNLHQEVEAGRFHKDLLYQLRMARINLPSLVQRREDIPLLAASFLREFRATRGREVQEISREAMAALVAYHWPGNVRELKSAIEFAAMRSAQRVIQLAHLPPEVNEEARPDKASEILPEIHPETLPQNPLDKRQQVLAALEEAGGNRTTAARLLGVSRATFYRRLADLDIKPTR